MTDVQVESDRIAREDGSRTLQEADLTRDQRMALDLLREMFSASGQEVYPVVRAVQSVYLQVELTGKDAEEIWSHSGRALDALQYLCNLILSRRITSDLRLALDAAGYRERRADALRQRAHDLAMEVKERNQEAELEPLPPHERRIIHNALLEDPDVTTYSEGEEPDRHIVITPRR